MIQTEVKALGSSEHQIDVTIAQSEYDAVYAEQLKKLSQQVKLPGFRHGKVPPAVLKKQLGDKVHDETVSELLQKHYAEIIEQSGLMPAVQPELDMPHLQEGRGLVFSMKIATWPKVDVGALNKLSFDKTEVEVEAADIDAVIERLMKSQVTYDEQAERAAEQGDQVHIDFVGFVDGEPFDGGRGENVALVLGEGRFIPGFEDQLLGKKAGEDCVIEVTFPADYQAAHLAGKAARFETVVKSVAAPVHADDEDALAKMLGFDDGAALREDVRQRLEEEAEQASREATANAALDALLVANPVELPEMLVAQDMRETMQRVLQNMKQQGVEVTREMIEDEGFRDEVRRRSERGLKLSILLQTVREQGDINVSDAEIDADIERQAARYPEEQQQQFKQWVSSQQEQRESIRERLLEGKCVDYIVSQANTNSVRKTLSAWQEEHEQQA